VCVAPARGAARRCCHGVPPARSSGVATVLNVAPAKALRNALLADTTMCVLNAGELAAVAGDSGVGAHVRECAGWLLARGVSAVVVTQGAEDTVAVTVDDGCVRRHRRLGPTAAGSRREE
jgi:sugar/nucleoside kinase (ribokinase family)